MIDRSVTERIGKEVPTFELCSSMVALLSTLADRGRVHLTPYTLHPNLVHTAAPSALRFRCVAFQVKSVGFKVWGVGCRVQGVGWCRV